MLATLLALTLAAGCATPRPVDQLLRPGGETVTIETAEAARVRGELIGIAGDRLVLLRGDRLLAVPFGAFSRVDVDWYPAAKTSDRRELRLYARYPQGLSDEQWRQLLLERGQRQFDSFPPPQR